MLVNADNRAPEYQLIPVSLTGLGTSRNEHVVNNIDAAFDGDDGTFANAAFWGSGQGVLITLPEAVRIGKARLLSDTYDGPGWGNCQMNFGTVSISNDITEGKSEKIWTGDMMITSIDVIEYARTRIYAIEIWEKI